MEFRRVLEERLAFFRLKFWQGDRWILLQPGARSKQVYFFKDYLDADMHAQDARMDASWKILTLTRAIKLLMHTAYDRAGVNLLSDFLCGINDWEVNPAICEDAVAHLLRMEEYIPVVWKRPFHPLSNCTVFKVVSNKGAVLFEGNEISTAVVRFRVCREQKNMMVKLMGVFNGGVSGRYVGYDEICFYECTEGGTIVQVHDPTEEATLECGYFVKYDFQKRRVFFFSPALRKCRPGDLFKLSSQRRFLASAITRYELLPIKMF